MAYQREDSWYRRAKQEGYRSRAAYKLIELHRRFKLLRPGMRVVDLGCAPGGWLQVLVKEVGGKGRVVGMDRAPVEPLGSHRLTVLVGDVTESKAVDRLREALGGVADLVLSDMAPDTSGVGFADHARSVELVRVASALAVELLGSGGILVAKVFEGADLNSVVEELRATFGKVQRVRPRSTRKGSRELYLIAGPFVRSREERLHGKQSGSSNGDGGEVSP